MPKLLPRPAQVYLGGLLGADVKIVVLDWVYFERCHMERLRSFGKLVVYDDIANTDVEVIRRINEADIVITASTNISRHILYNCQSLKMISLACTGHNRIDINAAIELGINVTNVPSYATSAVAEHTFALLFALLKKIKESDHYVRNGRYDWREIRIDQLEGKTFGIIGFGRIGSRVANIANCFRCEVVANTPHPPFIELAKLNKVRFLGLDELLAESHIISLHVPLNPRTEGLIGYREFAQMKKTPILINTARGKVIHYDALINALVTEKISGVGLDVLPSEPLQKDDPLLKFPNAVFSPHIAFYTIESLKKCADIVLSNIVGFVEGRLRNVVS